MLVLVYRAVSQGVNSRRLTYFSEGAVSQGVKPRSVRTYFSNILVLVRRAVSQGVKPRSVTITAATYQTLHLRQLIVHGAGPLQCLELPLQRYA